MHITVVLADDHAILREGISKLLAQHEDIRIVGQAADGREAVNETLRLGPAVVVMDISMPQLSGIEATRAILAAQPRTAVLILSAHGSGPVVEEALRTGARGYLSKTSSFHELVKAIRTVVAGKRYLGPGIAEQVSQDGRRLGYLTGKEHKILRLAAEGKSNMQMASVLGLSARTVETYRARMMRKLDLANVAALVKFAIRQGIVGLD